MTLEEFKEKAKNEDRAPGWDAIEGAFSRAYPDTEPQHYATDFSKRAMLGGNEFLDGYSFYRSPKGYWHVVTFGMTHLYVQEDAFGDEWNKWGYEMTMTLLDDDIDNCLYAAGLLSNVARYTYHTKKFFEPYHVIGCSGSINTDVESKLTALLAVEDTEIQGVDTVYGRTDFIQFVGITAEEHEMLMEDPGKAPELANRIREKYPELETDLNRTESFVF